MTPRAPDHGSAADARARAEMDDAPPFLTWRAIYLIVLGALGLFLIVGVVYLFLRDRD